VNVKTVLVLTVGILFSSGCRPEAGDDSSSNGTQVNHPSSESANNPSDVVSIPEQGGGVIVIGDTKYPVVADWSCNFMSYADTLGATGHGADNEALEFAFNLTLQSSGNIVGQITLKLTDQDLRWETADAGGDEAASGITEAKLGDGGASGLATFRQRGSGEWDASSGFEEGSFIIRCPSK